MLDILQISSRLFKNIIQKMAVRTIKNSFEVDVNLNLETLSVRHSDGEKIQFNITVNGEMTEKEFQKLIERALN